MIIIKPYHVQYGLGVKVYREIGGDGVFSTLRRYSVPVGRYLFHKVLTPFVKNNKQELGKQSINIIKRLASGKKPQVQETIKNIQQIFESKPLSEHLRGEGINFNKKKKRKRSWN